MDNGTKNSVVAQKYAKVELHLHLDGSVSLDSAKQLASLCQIELGSDEEILEKLTVGDGCKDLNEYLEKFAFPCSLLQNSECIELAVRNLLCELTKMGILYSEIRFATQKHTENGLSQEEAVRAAIDGVNKSSAHASLILCCMSGDCNRKENLETVRIARKYLGKGVAAIDLAGAEALYPTENFDYVFNLARELSVPFTIHAGEACVPDSVYKAVGVGASRIGHGVRSVEDERLLELLSQKNVTLELCPTSNINNAVFDSFEQYPLRKLMSAGVRVCLNSDNMSVSATDLVKEFEKMIRVFGLDENELKILAENAVDASFASEDIKQKIKNELKSV